jgi:hypothetical protein
VRADSQLPPPMCSFTMRHSIRIEGYAFDLRPVEFSDAPFIVQMRTADPTRLRYLHPVPPDVERQRAWLVLALSSAAIDMRNGFDRLTG